MLDTLRQRILADPALLARVRNVAPDDFAPALLALAAEQGLALTETEIADALRNARREWIERHLTR